MATDRQEGMRRRRARNIRFADKSVFPGIRWDGYEHHDLYNMIHVAKPAHLHDMAGGWRMLGKAIGETTEAVQKTLRTLSAGWAGSASAKAQESTQKISQWAAELADKTHDIGSGLHHYAGAVHHAQRVMPPPEFAYAKSAAQGHDPFTMVSGPAHAIEISQLTTDQKPNFDKHHAAYREAIRVMENYGAQSQTVHDDMPDLPPAPPQRSPGPPDPGPGPDQGSGPDPGPGQPPDQSDPENPNDHDRDEDTTTSSAADPTRALTATNQPGPGTGPDSGARGGPGTGLGVGAGLPPGGGAGARGVGQGARSGSGSMAARGGTSGGLHGTGGAAGARGGVGTGYPPFGAGGAGAQDEDDAEHKNKYDEGLDLFDDLPPAYPPVFGA